MNNVINYNGIEYTLEFNLNVMEEIQEKFGSVEKWLEMSDSDAEPRAKDIKFGFMCMINEGIDIYNETHDDKRTPFTDKQVGRIITSIGLSNLTQAINNTVIESTKSDEKNA